MTTDKEKVAELVVNSTLIQCLNEANLNGLKATVTAELAKELSAPPKTELEKLGGGDCSESAPRVSAETYFRRGKALVALDEYKPAMVCLMRAQTKEIDTQVYRDSCTQIATMYELGWGVDKDMETAKAWLKKAGM